MSSDRGTKASLLNLKQFRLDKDSGEQSLGRIPGRKRLQAIQDSDSENEPHSPERKKSKFELSTNEKEKRFSSASKIVPSVDSMVLQDSLIRFNWDVSKAIRYLKEQQIVNRNNNPPANLKATSLHSHDNSKSQSEPNHVQTNGTKDSTVENETESEDNDLPMENLNQSVYDSDEDSDCEISDTTKNQRKSVLEFLNSASQNELMAVKSCSDKKIPAILESRPFSNWNDLRNKFETNKSLTTDILNNCQDLLVKRSNVAKMMNRCNKLVKKLEAAIEKGGGVTEQPSILNSSLKLADYQIIGLNWLVIMHKEKMNGILADEMGLGKTIQIIAFLTYLKQQNLSKGCHLIVVPSSTLDNWEGEIAKWSPALVVEKYYGSQEERRALRMKYAKQGFKDLDVMLTTYHTMGSTPEERKMFRVTKLHYVVFDEAHMLKNMTTQRYSQLSTINAEMRILLTGTPLQNNLLELMSLLCFVMPSFFGKNVEDIRSLFQKKKIAEDTNSFEQTQIQQAKRIMNPFLLRRLKKDVLQCLPKKTEHVVKVPMASKQKEHYKELVEYYSNCKGVIKGSDECAGVTIMMDMRKLGNHPLLMRHYYTDDDLHALSRRLMKCPTYKSDNPQHIFEDLAYLSDFQVWEIIKKHEICGMDVPDDLVVTSGKFQQLDKMLPNLQKDGHRTLIFSQFTMMLDVLERYLSIRSYDYVRLDGSTPVTERQELIDRFNEDSDIFIFLLSTKAGGMGINLTAADTAIIHDIDFNPYNDKQAEDRCHRMGQTKPVNIYRLISEGTIEEGMLMVAQEKLKLEQEITSEQDNAKEHKGMVRLLTMALGMDDSSAENLLPKNTPTKF